MRPGLPEACPWGRRRESSSNGTPSADPPRRLMDVADECLESSLEDFKLTVTDIVDTLEVSVTAVSV